MEQVVYSRFKEYTDPARRQVTLAMLLAEIAADETLPGKRRADMCSGVRSLCRALNLQIESTPADPRLIADRLSGITPAAAGMKRGRLQNCKCHMDAALAYGDARVRRRRQNDAIAPEYLALLQQVPDAWAARRLRRLFHFCTEQKVAPETIGDVVFGAFLKHLGHSTQAGRPRCRPGHQEGLECARQQRAWLAGTLCRDTFLRRSLRSASKGIPAGPLARSGELPRIPPLEEFG